MSKYRLAMRTGLAGLVLLAGSALAAAEIEAGLPEQTTAVLTVNLKQLLHAPLLKQHGLASLQHLCQNSEGVRAVLETLGLDPFRDLDRLTVAMVGLGEKAEGVYILRGRFDTARFALTAKNLVKEHGDRFVMHKDDDLKYLSVVSTGGHGSIVFGTGVNSKKGAVLNVQTKGCLLDTLGGVCIAQLDKNTLVVATSEELLTETCKRLADKDTSVLNRPMRRLLAELDGKQTILFAFRPVPPISHKTEATSTSATHGYSPYRGGYQQASTGPVSDTAQKDALKLPPSPLKVVPHPPPPELFLIARAIDACTEAQKETDKKASPPPLPEPASSEARPGPSKPWLRELSGNISLADDFKLRCTLRATSSSDAKEVMKGFDELRLRMGGLMTLLAGSNKEYAFLKDIPRSFLAARKGRIILVEGRLTAEMLAKLLGACVEKGR